MSLHVHLHLDNGDGMTFCPEGVEVSVTVVERSTCTYVTLLPRSVLLCFSYTYYEL